MSTLSTEPGTPLLPSAGAFRPADLALSGESSVLPWPVFLGLVITSVVVFFSVAAAILLQDRPDAFLGEWTFATVFSAGQIAACSALSIRIALMRRGQETAANFWKRSTTLWWAMAAAFAFLAVDELFEVHESIDLMIHQWLLIAETPLTDRIDDVIVGLYGLAALWFLHHHRRELSFFRSVRPLVRAGFLLLFAMVAMDLLTNSWGTPPSVTPDAPAIRQLSEWANVGEESLKLFAETLFMMSFIGVAALVEAHRAAR